MDSAAELARLRAENDNLRRSQSQYANQAHVLRQQVNPYHQDSALDNTGASWFNDLLGSPQQSASPQVAPPATDSITMTQQELEAVINKRVGQQVSTLVDKRLQSHAQAQQQADSLSQQFLQKFVQEEPDLVKHSSIVRDVWQNELALNPKADPNALYYSAVQKTKDIVGRVKQVEQPTTNPYGGNEPYGGMGAPNPYGQFQQARGQGNFPAYTSDNGTFLNVEGNVVPEFRDRQKEHNRSMRAKALGTYVPPAK